MINGLRLKQAREILGRTQDDLAKELNVSQSTIAYIEGGYLQPTEDLVQKICEVTLFPQSFFERMEVSEFPYGSLLYRSRTSLDASEKAQANRYGQLMFEVAETLSKRLPRKPKYQPLSLPKGRVDAIICAHIVRSNLGYVPDKPIDDLIYDLEQHGVLIFNSPIPPFSKIDAFSTWAGYENKKPVIVLIDAEHQTTYRTRWTVAHEFAHLVLHATLFGDIREFEREANTFAAELLLPEATMERLVVGPLSLLRALKIMEEWKVSIQAVVKRAHELQLITDNNYKSLYVQISQQKKRIQEIEDKALKEKPRSLRSMAEEIYKKIDYQQFARDTDLPTSVLKEIIESQASKEEYTRSNASEGKVIRFPEKKAMNYHLLEEDVSK
ncbi:MAG TPA: XRE family transcriptional regulator [Ktedonobacteraceae bacterium]|nr:XRE family transcriptional regulator [Ktedonobacteraceae bacterium]